MELKSVEDTSWLQLFIKNSRYPLLCAPSSRLPGRGPSFPEVTRAFCLVPSTSFSQAPWYSLPVHLCRFGVRSIRWSYFLEHLHRTGNPINRYDTQHSSLPAGPGIL